MPPPPASAILRHGWSRLRTFLRHAARSHDGSLPSRLCAAYALSSRYGSGLGSSGGFMVLQLHRADRHDGRDRVLVNKLDLTVPAQEDAEIIEPGDIPLQFHAVDQINRNRGFALAD